MNAADEMQVDEWLACVVARLPARAGAISAEFERSESFRGLCEDFHVCSEAVARWQQKEGPGAIERQQEYAESLAELEQEILGWIEARPADDG